MIGINITAATAGLSVRLIKIRYIFLGCFDVMLASFCFADNSDKYAYFFY